MTDIWVCGTCHSINRQRSTRCYKCGAAQEVAATGQGSTLRVEHAVEARVVIPYRPAWPLGLLAALLILVVAAYGVYLLIPSIEVVGWAKDQFDVIAAGGEPDQAELDRRLAEAGNLGLIRLALVIPALLAFAAWLSRVIANIPALGGGVPGTSSTRAFVSALIPVYNLRKVPAMVQDALYRVDPKAGGFFMVAFAWIGLVGSWLVSYVVGRWIELRLAGQVHNAKDPGAVIAAFKEAVDKQLVLDAVTTFLIAFGSVVLILVMARIESRSAARDREIRAAVGV